MNGFEQALKQACAAVGLDADGARLLRLGSNAVYHLKAPVIARISRPGTDIIPVRRSVAVARWLESAEYPAVRAVNVDQPVIADDYVVTFWQSVSDDGDAFASTPEIADVIARLHRLTALESTSHREVAEYAQQELSALDRHEVDHQRGEWFGRYGYLVYADPALMNRPDQSSVVPNKEPND